MVFTTWVQRGGSVDFEHRSDAFLPPDMSYFMAKIVTSLVFVHVVLGGFVRVIWGDELLSLSFYLPRTPFISFFRIR